MTRAPVAAALAIAVALPSAARAQLSAPPPPAGAEPEPVAEERGAAPPGAAAGERAEGLGQPEPGVTRPRRPRRGAPEAAGETEEPAEPWTGPRVELGYTHYVVADGFGGGDVHAGLFGGYLDTGVARLGASLEAGARSYAIGQDDALVRLSVLAGYQHLDWAPFVPYAGVVATVGWLVGKRFRTPLTHTLFGGGLEIGADANLTRSLYVGVGLGYLRVGADGVGRDLWVLRLRVGL